MKLGKTLSLALALLALAFATLRVDVAQATITEFSEGLTAGSRPAGLAAGPDGNLWFTSYGRGEATPSVGRVTPDGDITEFRKGLGGGFPQSIVAGPDANMWFGIAAGKGSSPAIGRITPAGEITRFAELTAKTDPDDLTVGPGGRIWWVSNSGSRPGLGYVKPGGPVLEILLPTWPNDIVAGPDGNMWFTYGEGATAAIAKVEAPDDPGKTKITYYRDGLGEKSDPRQIVLGPDGNLWFADPWVEAIGKVTPTGAITEFDAGDAQELVAGPDGNVWFRGWGIGRITPTGEVTSFSLPADGESRRPRDLTLGPDGNVWYAATYEDEPGNGAIGRITPLGQAEEYNVGLNPGTSPREIALGPDGNLWFTDLGEPAAIGRATLTGNGYLPRRELPPFEQGVIPMPPQIPQPPQIPRAAPASPRILVNDAGVAMVKLHCFGSLPCDGVLVATVMKRGWRAPRRIGAAPFSIGAGSAERVRLQLNRVGRELLRAAGGRRSAQITVQPRGPMMLSTYPMKLISRG